LKQFCRVVEKVRRARDEKRREERESEGLWKWRLVSEQGRVSEERERERERERVKEGGCFIAGVAGMVMQMQMRL